jgi:uncharacterized protein
MDIQRKLLQNIVNQLDKQKVSLLLGARRVGKTSLLQTIKAQYGAACLWLNGEDENVAALLNERSEANYNRVLQGYTLVIIDEAQFVPDIGRKLKLMIDTIAPLHIIVTGSSAFDIGQMGEPLVGRTLTYQMYPVAQAELDTQENLLQTKQNLEERLLFGSYPEVLNLPTLAQKQQYLAELINTYLLKDILAFENIRNPQKLKDLLVLLAWQIGSEVSLDELGRNLGINKNTVHRYLDLLEKVFVLYKRSGYSKNLRKEVAKSNRWYFVDNGIRNALINNFNFMALRQDTGMLWENYIVAERLKKNSYEGLLVNSYFWRTYDQQEIDLLEEQNGMLTAFECKWTEQKTKPPAAFAKAYPGSSFHVLHKNNYLNFIV